MITNNKSEELSLYLAQEDRRVANEQFLVLSRAVIEYAQIAIRAVLLANGAGATAVIAFLGDAMSRTAEVNVRFLGLAAFIFSLGVVAGVMATFFAYLSQHELLRRAIAESGRISFGTSRYRLYGIIYCFSSLFLFVFGIAIAVWGYLGAAQ